MLQAHWQYSSSSIAQGFLHGSSILDDESKSLVNSKVLALQCHNSDTHTRMHTRMHTTLDLRLR